MTDLAFASALEQARAIRDAEVSSRELVDLYLDRIEALDGELNSYVLVLADQARGAAADKDARTAAGDDLPAFHGVPVSIKELDLVEGQPATFGTRAMAGWVAPFDSHVVARLERAGMVLLGKTNVPELGSVPYTEPALFGPARNPWNREHTPGGSSGGAAAALAAGLCPVAQGSDGGGSIRIPASNCGLFGLKPTRDRVSGGPLGSDLAFGLSTKGVLTRTVADSAALLDEIAGYAPGDPGYLPAPADPFAAAVGAHPGRLRVGVWASSPFGDVDPRVLASVDDARTLLEALGHETVDAPIDVPDEIVHAFERVWGAMVSSQPFPVDQLEPLNRWLAAKGTERSAGGYLADQFQLQLYCRQLVGRFHGEFDLLLSPVLAEPPLRVGELDGLDPESVWDRVRHYALFTPLFNATGQPAASVPLWWDEATGLPLGVQLVGRMADEATLLAVSAQLEAARPWADRRPPGLG